MQINAKTMIGLDIIGYLEKNEDVKSTDLIEHLDVSKPYFEQCVKFLVNSGLVIAKRGCMGGYALRVGVITYWDLIQAYGNKGWMLDCTGFDAVIAEFIEVAKKHKIVG